MLRIGVGGGGGFMLGGRGGATVGRPGMGERKLLNFERNIEVRLSVLYLSVRVD